MIKLGYILSHAYSGSTLMSLMLGAHSQITALGEFQGGASELLTNPELVESYICSCGARVLSCPFWNDLSVFMQKNHVRDARFPNLGNRFTAGRRMWLFKILNRSLRFGGLEYIRRAFLYAYPNARRYIRRIGRNNCLAMEKILRETNAAVFIDASKNPARLEYLAFTPDLTIYPILLTRDPRGVALSVLKRKKSDALSAARSWRRYHLFAQRTLSRMKSRYCHIRYEDLCRRPDEIMTLLHRYLGLEPESWPPVGALPVSHALGNDMRLHFDGAVHPPVRWQEQMNSKDRQVIDRVCGPLMRKFGYKYDGSR